MEGSFKCECDEGFEYDEKKNLCLDIDECINNDPCMRSALEKRNPVCINTIGSYFCDCNHELSSAYDHNQQLSIDYDYYEEQLYQSSSFNMMPQENQSLSMPWARSFLPSNLVEQTSSSFSNSNTWILPMKYVYENHKCIPIDRCEVENNPCGSSDNIVCHKLNNHASACTCNEGFKKLEIFKDSFQCIDINECDEANRKTLLPDQLVHWTGTNENENDSRGLGGCYEKCINLHGSYKCSCRHGYEWRNGKCEDIDECEEDRPCLGGCRNTDGGYECLCPHGYATELFHFTGTDDGIYPDEMYDITHHTVTSLPCIKQDLCHLSIRLNTNNNQMVKVGDIICGDSSFCFHDEEDQLLCSCKSDHQQLRKGGFRLISSLMLSPEDTQKLETILRTNKIRETHCVDRNECLEWLNQVDDKENNKKRPCPRNKPCCLNTEPEFQCQKKVKKECVGDSIDLWNTR